MAVTIAIVDRNAAGMSREVFADVTGPASYTTGGETLTAAQQAQLMPEAGLPPTANFTAATYLTSEQEPALGRSVVLDKANNKLLFYAGGTQVTAATNLSAVMVRCKIQYLIFGDLVMRAADKAAYTEVTRKYRRRRKRRGRTGPVFHFRASPNSTEQQAAAKNNNNQNAHANSNNAR